MYRNDNIIVEIACMIALRHFLSQLSAPGYFPGEWIADETSSWSSMLAYTAVLYAYLTTGQNNYKVKFILTTSILEVCEKLCSGY